MSDEIRECDWPEDFAHENGQYVNKCIRCRESFIGHKRRATCKRCDTHGGQVSGIEETVARVRDALDGVPDSTTLYARGMKLTGWRHEVTAGEVRILLAAVDTRTRERDEAVAKCEAYRATLQDYDRDIGIVQARADRYRAALENIAERPSYPVDNRDAFETAISRANRALTEDA